MRPKRATRSRRLPSPVFRRIFVTWDSTVFRERPRRLAMASFFSPSSAASTTRRCAGVSPEMANAPRTLPGVRGGGPYGVVKPGAALAARRAGAILVPMGAACARATVFARAWDRYVLAWPFSRATVVLGPPCEPDALGRAIGAANDEARAILAGSSRNMVPLRRFSGAEAPTETPRAASADTTNLNAYVHPGVQREGPRLL